MSTDTAYRTADPAVVEAYEKWKAEVLAIRDKRRALIDAVGRNLYISGHGYSTRVEGFERFDSDKDGDTLHHDGSLIVSTKRGQHDGMIVPNLKRKSGKKFAEELRTYTTPGLDLPGLPGMHVYSVSAGLVMGHAKVHLWDGVVYALWGCDNAPMGEQWETIPLSTYYLAREQWDAEISKQEEAGA